MNKLQALEALLVKVRAGADLEDMHEAPAALGTRGETAFFIRAYKGSRRAAKALHEAVLPTSPVPVDRGIKILQSPNPARSWLIVIIETLVAQEKANG